MAKNRICTVKQCPYGTLARARQEPQPLGNLIRPSHSLLFWQGLRYQTLAGVTLHNMAHGCLNGRIEFPIFGSHYGNDSVLPDVRELLFPESDLGSISIFSKGEL